ncbi:SDR family oxidoreductase [Vitreoscilla massiliensis]|uniref:SDR family oxidoreductase n=1 Tax=Vitreoscilla massiliensis TaxID=1689272 RepID=A0ABY4E3A3_9NEIS|nr:SDR family oxidoreductase [Vitreoscilla massiliensis]UOO90233.1 SDR family oxidoreductase [Vitreoscilla massiliensis]
MMLNQKIVVVTGAGRGLGAAFALSLAPLGCELILCARREEDLAQISECVVNHGGKIPKIIQLDLSDVASVRAAADSIANMTEYVDVLINNGAMWLESSDVSYAETDVLNVVNAAITGTFLFVQNIMPLLKASQSPDVLTIGSISGLPNAALQSVSVPFYAAKRGQVALAEGLRQEFNGSPLRSILINPPYLDDALPGEKSWIDASARVKGDRGTTRDIVEAV